MTGPVAGPSLPFAARSDRKTAGSTSTGAVNGTFVDIPFETNDFVENPTPGFISKPNNTDFTLAFPGIYRCEYSLRPNPAANYTGWEARAALDGVAIPQSGVIGTSRNLPNENSDTGKGFLFRTTTANQVLKIQAAPTEAAAVGIEIGSTCSVELVRLT